MNLAEWLYRTARTRPDAPALLTGDPRACFVSPDSAPKHMVAQHRASLGGEIMGLRSGVFSGGQRLGVFKRAASDAL